jgi:hypothetical protein
MRQHYSFAQSLKKIGLHQYSYYRRVKQSEQSIIMKMRTHYSHYKKQTPIDKLIIDFLNPEPEKKSVTAEDLIQTLVMGSQQNELSLPTSLVSSLYKNNSDSQNHNSEQPDNSQKSF